MQRPINLNLATIKFPVAAISSILHRISGFILFLCIPLMLWLMQLSLTENGFSRLTAYMHNPLIKFAVWFVLASYIYHLLAGIRHLFMDVGLGETLTGGKVTAWLVIFLSFLLILMAGVWLWFII